MFGEYNIYICIYIHIETERHVCIFVYVYISIYSECQSFCYREPSIPTLNAKHDTKTFVIAYAMAYAVECTTICHVMPFHIMPWHSMVYAMVCATACDGISLLASWVHSKSLSTKKWDLKTLPHSNLCEVHIIDSSIAEEPHLKGAPSVA